MTRSLTKPPVALGSEALEVAREALRAYFSPFSRKDFTQHKLFAILVLRQFFKTDYRGIYRLLEDLTDLRARKTNSQERETRLRVLTHNLMIVRRFSVPRVSTEY